MPRFSPISLGVIAAIAALVAVIVVSAGGFGERSRTVTVTDVNSRFGIENGSGQTRELKVDSLLPFDAIPSIDQPRFLGPETSSDSYQPDELVLGVEINGDARAYSIATLSRHEIVNDVVGGKPVAITW